MNGYEIITMASMAFVVVLFGVLTYLRIKEGCGPVPPPPPAKGTV